MTNKGAMEVGYLIGAFTSALLTQWIYRRYGADVAVVYLLWTINSNLARLRGERGGA